MGQFITYKCDKCKKTWVSTDKTEQPVSIAILVDFGNPSGQPKYSQYLTDNNAMWCRTCVMKAGIKEPYTDTDVKVAPPEPLPFEEKLTLLLEELGFIREI